MPTQKVHKSDSIFKTISGNPRPEPTQAPAGQTPAPAVKEAPQPTVTPVAGGQSDLGQTAQAAPQSTSQAPTQTPPQDDGTQPQPKEYVIDDPEAVIVNGKGEKIRLKDAEFYGFSRQRQLEEQNRIDKSRRDVQELAGKLNTKLSDPVVKDYLYLSEAHPEWTPEEVRDAALRANGKETVLPRAPEPVEEKLPEPPAGAVPGDKDWNDWLAQVASVGADRAIKKHVAPLIAAEESRKQDEVKRQQLDRVASANVDLIRNRTQGFTHVDLDDLSQDEKGVFYGRVGEVLAKRGLVFDDRSGRWNTPTGAIDENVYAFGVEAAWPEGSSPKKAQQPSGQSPADIVSRHMNNGLGLVPDKQPTPTPTPPSGAMPVRTPMKNPGAGRKSDNPLRDLMQTGSVRGLTTN